MAIKKLPKLKKNQYLKMFHTPSITEAFDNVT